MFRIAFFFLFMELKPNEIDYNKRDLKSIQEYSKFFNFHKSGFYLCPSTVKYVFVVPVH